jgi:magnesium transporter
VSLYLSDVIGRPLVNAQGRPLGRLVDLVARSTDDEAPPLLGAVVRRGHEDLWLPIDAVALLDAPRSRLILVETVAALRPLRPGRARDLMLGRDLLDREVIDVRCRRVVRVKDVPLDDTAGHWAVWGVDCGVRAALRRLMPTVLQPWVTDKGGGLLPWAAVALLPRLAPGGCAAADGRCLAGLTGADVARIVGAVPLRQAVSLLAVLDDARAAAALTRLPRGRAARLLERLGPTQSAALLGRLPAHSAAALLSDLAPARAATLLRRMDPDVAAVAHARLTYPRGTVGALMSVPTALVPAWLHVGEAATFLRGQRVEVDGTPLLCVVTNRHERRLLGVVEPRALTHAEPETPLQDLLHAARRPVLPMDRATRVARVMRAEAAPALPVTDDGGRLLGIVTSDDVDAAARRRLCRFLTPHP